MPGLTFGVKEYATTQPKTKRGEMNTAEAWLRVSVGPACFRPELCQIASPVCICVHLLDPFGPKPGPEQAERRQAGPNKGEKLVPSFIDQRQEALHPVIAGDKC